MKPLFLLFFFGFCTISAQKMVSLTANADAAIGYHTGFNTSGNNYGSAQQNAIYIIPGALGGKNVNRALIKFDLTQIPKDAVIKSAKLNLFALGPIGTLPGHIGNQNSISIRRVTSTWTEFGVSWENQPSSISDNEVILPPAEDANKDYKEIDVTAMVIDQLKYQNFGFLLVEDEKNIGNGLVFASKDSFNPSKYPRLDVEYTIQLGTNNEVPELLDIAFYPNPLRQYLNVDTNLEQAHISDAKLWLFNIVGQKVLDYTLISGNNQISLNNISSGVYVAQVIVANQVFSTRKITILHD